MTGNRIDAVLATTFGSRDEITIDELRAALLLEYSEAELLRRGARNRGSKRRPAACYEAGEPIEENERWKLRNEGLNLIVRLCVKPKKWIKIDKERGVVIRVRT